MKERPIIFGAESIRAILEGRKTQTRRVIKTQFNHAWGQGCPNRQPVEVGDFYKAQKWRDAYAVNVDIQDASGVWLWLWCPYGKIGDRLWVRETWAATATRNNVKPSELTPGEFIAYRATYSNSNHFVWRPSIFMPRWASRITLEITGIRVERVQDISEEDAKAEGVEPGDGLNAIEWMRGAPTVPAGNGNVMVAPYGLSYMRAWDSLNRKRGFGWEQNPFVWVIGFKRINP